MTCQPHNDEKRYVLKPDHYKRRGWHAVYCAVCGKFIGFRRPDQ